MSEQSKLISIKEAASILGVTTLTLRNWDKSAKLKALRHPMNNYRVYKREEVEKLVSDISENKTVPVSKKSTEKKLTVIHIDETTQSDMPL